MEYKTPHMPQLNGVTKMRFAFIKAVVLDMILNEKLNDTDQKMLWSEAVHTYEGVQNSISSTGSTESPLFCYHSLDLSNTSLKGEILRNK